MRCVSAQRRARSAEMSSGLAAVTDRAALEQYGISVVDVRIKRINLPEQNKPSVFARMRAERERIARQYRAEGEEQALSIRADADRQKTESWPPPTKRPRRPAARATLKRPGSMARPTRRTRAFTSCYGHWKLRKCWMTRPRRFWVRIPRC